MKRIPSQPTLFIISTLLLLLNTACSAEVIAPDTPTPTEPVIITATLPPTGTPLPSPMPEPATATVAIVPAEGQTISQLNVRGAPSAESDLLGSIPIATKVQIVGKDPTSGWWLITYPESPSGMGWVTAQFVQVADPSGVPVISGGAPAVANTPIAEAGPTVETGGAEVPSPAPTPVLTTAIPDGDSAQSPATSITLSGASVRSFNYSSDISSPEGDAEDWVQFSLDGQSGQQSIVVVMLNCSGSSALNVGLIQSTSLLDSWENIPCGQTRQLQLYLFAGAPYYLHLTPAQGNSPINYVAYTVSVQLTK